MYNLTTQGQEDVLISGNISIYNWKQAYILFPILKLSHSQQKKLGCKYYWSKQGYNYVLPGVNWITK